MAKNQQNPLVWAYIVGALLLIFLLGKFVLGIPFFGEKDSSDTTTESQKNSEALCSREYDPVCTDEGTYANLCLAEKAGYDVVYSGSCNPEHERTRNIPPSLSTGSSDDSSGNMDTDENASPVATGSQSRPPQSLQDVYGTGDTSQSGSLALYDSGSYHLYHNESLDYSFAMPNYSYYKGYGPRDEALHTMAVALTASGIENFEDAPVRVYFYKTTPNNPPSDLSVVVPHGIVYIAASGEIDAKLKRIIDTIEESAE